MELARKLSEGVGAWLQFQYACNNSGLFSEKYLAEPIGRILSSLTNERVMAEYPHPVLAPLATGSGRRPAVDFVVCEPYPDVKFAIESKWVGQTKPSVQSIAWDLIRLEQIAHLFGARCYFLLAGMKRSLDAYFDSDAFAGPSPRTTTSRLLHAHKSISYEVVLSATSPHRIKLLKDLFEPYQHVAFPHKLLARRTEPFPPQCKANQYQVYVWEVSSKKKREIFYPKNSNHYALKKEAKPVDVPSRP